MNIWIENKKWYHCAVTLGCGGHREAAVVVQPQILGAAQPHKLRALLWRLDCVVPSGAAARPKPALATAEARPEPSVKPSGAKVASAMRRGPEPV